MNQSFGLIMSAAGLKYHSETSHWCQEMTPYLPSSGLSALATSEVQD